MVYKSFFSGFYILISRRENNRILSIVFWTSNIFMSAGGNFSGIEFSLLARLFSFICFFNLDQFGGQQNFFTAVRIKFVRGNESCVLYVWAPTFRGQNGCARSGCSSFKRAIASALVSPWSVYLSRISSAWFIKVWFTRTPSLTATARLSATIALRVWSMSLFCLTFLSIL